MESGTTTANIGTGANNSQQPVVKGILKPDTSHNVSKQPPGILKSHETSKQQHTHHTASNVGLMRSKGQQRSSLHDDEEIDTSSEYNTASESEFPRLHRQDDDVTLCIMEDEKTGSVDISNKPEINDSSERLKHLDIKTVTSDPTSPKDSKSKEVLNRQDSLVSKTTLRLSSSDTSDLEDHHHIKVVSTEKKHLRSVSEGGGSVIATSDVIIEEDNNNVFKSTGDGSQADVHGKDHKETVRKSWPPSRTLTARQHRLTDSSTDEESGIEKILRIKNDAVARRRLNRELRKCGDAR